MGKKRIVSRDLTLQKTLTKKSTKIPIDLNNLANYEDIKKKILPFDLIAFRGGDAVSDLITTLEQNRLKIGAFSHVGMVVSSKILSSFEGFILDPKKLYVFESTFSYNIGGVTDGVADVSSKKGKLGVQLRDLEEVIPTYITDPKTRVAWCKLLNNPFDTKDKAVKKELKRKFTELFGYYYGRMYELNMDSLLAAMFPRLRFIRRFKDSILNSLFSVLTKLGVSDRYNPAGWQFCSELIANIYQKIGVIDKRFDTKDVLPVDFFGYDEDGIPALVEAPVFFRDWDLPNQPATKYE